MTVARARAKKPTTVDEITRVLRIADMIVEEMTRRSGWTPGTDNRYRALVVAERIAARTED